MALHHLSRPLRHPTDDSSSSGISSSNNITQQLPTGDTSWINHDHQLLHHQPHGATTIPSPSNIINNNKHNSNTSSRPPNSIYFQQQSNRNNTRNRSSGTNEEGRGPTITATTFFSPSRLLISKNAKDKTIGSRSDEALEAMLASCSPKQLRGPPRSLGYLETAPPSLGYLEAPASGSERKRSFYTSFDTSEDAFDEDVADDIHQHGDKKTRRLGFEQVKALEKAFEIENRLEPERKVRLATQLGLQPRQVAVWFQNRRARWKTKQMERDYGVLKNKFETLKADRDELLMEKQNLQAEVTRLKGHVKGEKGVEPETEAQNPHHPASCVKISSNVQAASSDHKEADGFSSTDDSADSAIIDSGSPRTNISDPVPPEFADPGEKMMREAASGILDDPDFYHWRLASSEISERPIKSEEWLSEEEPEDTFIPLDWW